MTVCLCTFVHTNILIIIWFVAMEIRSWMCSEGIVFFFSMLIYLESSESTYSKYVQFIRGQQIILSFKFIASDLRNLLWNVLPYIKIKYAAKQIIRANWPFRAVLVISSRRITTSVIFARCSITYTNDLLGAGFNGANIYRHSSTRPVWFSPSQYFSWTTSKTERNTIRTNNSRNEVSCMYAVAYAYTIFVWERGTRKKQF